MFIVQIVREIVDGVKRNETGICIVEEEKNGNRQLKGGRLGEERRCRLMGNVRFICSVARSVPGARASRGILKNRADLLTSMLSDDK